MITLLVIAGVEQRACPVEGCTSLEGENGKLICTATLFSTCGILTKVTVVLCNLVLDIVAFVDDKLEDIIS